MPVINFGKRSAPIGDGWSESRLRNARDLLTSVGVSTNPSSMSHPDFCAWWADYRLTQMTNK